MSHLPMYARYSPERMAEEDDTSLDQDGNTLDGYRYNHFTPALRRQIGGHCFSGTKRRGHVI